ncbi:hypothetical protein RFI_00795 [Reticulomyxa filosa]|uniref:Uncharacterized protein n=1 Tax=Reticulomyxa filosa TaxID=46433 RepID=X6PF06_RETFI|nr:hypothetical protein RFI_00795 [Reticulomyxa filosa]|eukprot:ETO36262.1 hypothetical protein RFI_00795 [Reticulomyxa filosa]
MTEKNTDSLEPPTKRQKLAQERCTVINLEDSQLTLTEKEKPSQDSATTLQVESKATTQSECSVEMNEKQAPEQTATATATAITTVISEVTTETVKEEKIEWRDWKIVQRATHAFSNKVSRRKRVSTDGGNFLKKGEGERRRRRKKEQGEAQEKEKEQEQEITEQGGLKEYIQFAHPEPVYDVAWYPNMKSHTYPWTSLFITTSRDSPIVMHNTWDNQKCRAIYKLVCVCRHINKYIYVHIIFIYVFADAVETAYSVAFDRNCEYLYGGYERKIGQFNLMRPSDEPTLLTTVNPNQSGIKGRVTSLEFAPIYFQPNFFAAASYDGTTLLMDRRCQYPIASLKVFFSTSFYLLLIICFFFLV